MSDTLSIDFKKMLVNLESSSYKIPVLFRVLDNNVEPYFQFNYAWKLYEQLENFKQNDKFLWVDRCDVMNYIFSTNESGKLCISEGILGVKYKVKGVDKIKDYKIDGYENNLSVNSSLETIISNIDMLKRNGIEYKATLKDAILFKKEGYPSFLKNIEGVSYPDKLGRWTDAELHPSAIFTFKEPLASKFKLEIVCRAYGENVNENRVKIKVGNNIHEFTPQYKSPSKYTFEFDNLENTNIIEIVPPKPFENKEELEGSDTRKFGLFLVSLKIIDMENR
jgi:phosphoglycerol transferase